MLGHCNFDEEGAEHADADAEGDDEPEIDVLIRVDVGEPVDGCSEAYTEEDACCAQRAEVDGAGLAGFFRFVDEQFGRLRVRLVLNDELPDFFLLLVLLHLLKEDHDNDDDGNTKG